MGHPRTPTPCSLGGRPSNGSDGTTRGSIRESPQSILSPGASKADIYSPQLLFSYHHVLLGSRKSPTPPPYLTEKRAFPDPIAESTPQPKSIMTLKLDRLKDKWRDLRCRVSPAVFRFAGHIFMVIVLIAVGSVAVGWYGLSKDTPDPDSVATNPMTVTPVPLDYIGTLWRAQSTTYNRLASRVNEDTKQPSLTTTTSSRESDEITIVRTVILTVTSVITDTALKTLTTTVFISTCTTSVTTPAIDPSTSAGTAASTAGRVMTGIMYCSFTGRRNVYTLCPLVHTDSPGMLSSAPAAAVSSGAPRFRNPLGAVRLAAASLWNSVPGLGKAPPGHGDDGCGCDCAEMGRRLGSATDLVRLQQQLLDSQRAMIDEHRKGLVLALETLANITAVKVAEDARRDASLDLNI
ncbi:hypothetical protein F4802DRAFT_594741 [Xylaria palmicola]|nr:hypothetical protein F4802DRAFT_594741 [Xylaria palmicola]